jgi:hypothetical protein
VHQCRHWDKCSAYVGRIENTIAIIITLIIIMGIITIIVEGTDDLVLLVPAINRIKLREGSY